MKKANDSFFEYALSQSKDPDVQQWLKRVAEKYSKRLACPLCGDEREVDIIINPQAFIRCLACHTRNDFSIDKIQPTDYNTITFLHEDKIKAIFKTQESE